MLAVLINKRGLRTSPTVRLICTSGSCDYEEKMADCEHMGFDVGVVMSTLIDRKASIITMEILHELIEEVMG